MAINAQQCACVLKSAHHSLFVHGNRAHMFGPVPYGSLKREQARERLRMSFNRTSLFTGVVLRSPKGSKIKQLQCRDT